MAPKMGLTSLTGHSESGCLRLVPLLPAVLSTHMYPFCVSAPYFSLLHKQGRYSNQSIV